MNDFAFSDLSNDTLDMSNQHTFDHVFRIYNAIMCAFSERIVNSWSDAEDVVSEVFLKLWDKKSTFENEEHIRFFLYRSVRNASLNRVRATERITKKHEASSIDGSIITESNHLNEMIRSEVLLSIYQEIEKLSPQEKTVITLNLLEEKKLQEIADEMGLSLQSIKNCKTRALNKLRMRLPKNSYLLLVLLLQGY